MDECWRIWNSWIEIRELSYAEFELQRVITEKTLLKTLENRFDLWRFQILVSPLYFLLFLIGCTDGYDLCPVLAKNQLCNARVSTWVKVNCKKSCNNCPTPPKPQKPKCKYHRNATPSNCSSWKNSGFCNSSNSYYKWMKDHCSICNLCVSRWRKQEGWKK